MDFDEYKRKIGSLVVNLQSLEFILRAYLQGCPGAPPLGIPSGTDIYTYGVGEELSVNEITNYNSLGQLITKFNNKMTSQGGQLLDTSLVELRDALAHGRVSSDDPQGKTMRLIKFSHVDKKTNKVRVVFNEQLTAGWLSDQISRVLSAIHLVRQQMNP